jgi:hypothetical protein
MGSQKTELTGRSPGEGTHWTVLSTKKQKQKQKKKKEEE